MPPEPTITQDFLTPEQYADVQKAQKTVRDFQNAPVYSQENLSNENVFNVPTVPQTTSPQAQQAVPGSSLDALNQQINSLLSEQNNAQQQQTDLRTQMLSGLEKLAGKDQRVAELEKEKNISGQTKQLQEISNQLLALKNESIAIPLQIQNQFEGTGATIGGASAHESRLLRDNAIKSLTLSAQAQALQGNLALAQDEISRAIEYEFAPLQARQDYLELAYKYNQEDLQRYDAKRAEALNLAIQERSRILDEQKAQRETIGQIALYAASQGVDALTLRAIQNTTNPAEAQRIATEAIGVQEPERNTQVVEVGGKKVLIDTQTGETIRDLGYADVGGGGGAINLTPPISSNGETLTYGTPEYIVARLQQTSGSKTKPVASEREQLSQYGNVIAQTGNLISSLQRTDVDPIVGQLKSLNPYDFDARTINAQIQALVPGVARGVYGEVGVLTDQDIERYLLTLPNLKSTAEQNQFVGLLTLKNAMRSYEQTLLNLANSNVNVSGFVDSYNAISQEVGRLEKQLGVGSAIVQGEDEAIFDDVVGNTSNGGYFSNLFRALFGQ